MKRFVFRDALTRNRTDGAVVRVMIPLEDVADLAAAATHAEKSIRTLDPRIYYHIPQPDLIPHNGGPLTPDGTR